MLSKDEVHDKLKAGEQVYNYSWWLMMHEDGTIFGGCSEPGCCEWDFDSFDEMWNEGGFDDNGWN